MTVLGGAKDGLKTGRRPASIFEIGSKWETHSGQTESDTVGYMV
jgi:hypothetical protein